LNNVALMKASLYMSYKDLRLVFVLQYATFLKLLHIKGILWFQYKLKCPYAFFKGSRSQLRMQVTVFV